MARYTGRVREVGGGGGEGGGFAPIREVVVVRSKDTLTGPITHTTANVVLIREEA